MSNALHTPGPWEFDPATGRVDAVALRTPTGTILEGKDGSKREYIGGLVALPYGCHAGDYKVGKCDANARLIAAAPELLDALRRARSEIWRLLDVRGIEPKQASEWPEIVAADTAIAKATGEAA